MSAKITFFPVGNGDMTLIESDSGKKILIDCNIRKPDDEIPDVNLQLRELLSRDSEDRLYLDVFLWTHPDEDHCRGVDENFHLGKPSDWNKEKDKIFINEIWSSPIVYRRSSNTHKLCNDALALNKEAKRRVNFFRDNKSFENGNNILVLTEDEDGKTDDIQDILITLDEIIPKINDSVDNSLEIRLIGPVPKEELDEDEDKLGKNHSSVITNFKLIVEDTSVNFLNGGDAEVHCWENLWKRMEENNTTEYLEYDILQAPHHCSWHTLSHESWRDVKENTGTDATSDDAVNSLSNCRESAYIVSSSNKIEDNDNDPPCIGAKNKYIEILDDTKGTFKCVADNIENGENTPLVFEIDSNGLKEEENDKRASIFTNENPIKVNKSGGNGFA